VLITSHTVTALSESKIKCASIDTGLLAVSSDRLMALSGGRNCVTILTFHWMKSESVIYRTVFLRIGGSGKCSK